jgi:UDP-N-acetylmuramoyl-L-alanyl-D-glutamate--2,6-diaminopimelate ligase
MKSLHDIVAALRAADLLVRAPESSVSITSITDDSRNAAPGTLFCAVEGTTDDGHRYVADAVSRGASAVVLVTPVDAPVPQIVVRESRSAVSLVAGEWYGRPADDLTVAGVTGTNGKTTTVAYLCHLLNADRAAGSIGTLGAYDSAGEPLDGYGNLTTPGAIELHRALAQLRSRGVRRVVMEASSHALDQRRLETLRLQAAVYTNLTQDHLDYHRTLAAYRTAKERLSDQLEAGGVEVVNADDDAWQGLARRAGVRRVSYGRREPADVRAEAVTLESQGSRATFVFAGVAVPVRVPLLGDFNVDNALAAAAAAWALGHHPDEIAARLATTSQVPGRLELLVANAYSIIRDYAHTPDALERVLAVLRQSVPGRLIVLFGAGGDRDRGKRPMMGRAVDRVADVAIVTSDNPRTEAPDRIIDDVVAGMERLPLVRMTDRREAIAHGVSLLRPGDCLLLAGKGHETHQVIGMERIPFDEREIVRACLSHRGAT